MAIKIVTTFFIWLFILFSCEPLSFVSEAPSYESPHYSEDILLLINQYRMSRRLRPLLSDKKLTALAESHSYEMYRRGSINHDQFDDRFSKSGSNACVENVGWNYHTPKDQFTAWKDSEEHDRNMLDRDIRRAGISKIGAYVTFFACS